MATLLVFPYLPARTVFRVGGWTVIPGDAAPDDSFTTREVMDRAHGLLRLYGATPGRCAAGAFAAPPGGRIGDELPVEDIGNLRRAVLVGLLEGNPPAPGIVGDENAEPNRAWKTATSDNAAVWAHPVDSDGYTAVEYGSLVTVLSGGHNTLTSDSVPIRRPIEVPAAIMYGHLDGGYADAAMQVLAQDNDLSRRLSRTIDWLDLAWRNTDSTRPEVRIVLLRNAFEVLFDSGDTYAVRDALATLLDEPGTPVAERTWPTRGRRSASAKLSDLAWWFMQFAFLRNEIMHGGRISQAMMDFEGRSHFWLGEMHLRLALRATVAANGHPELRDDRATRETLARHRAMAEIIERHNPQSSEHPG